MGSFVKFGTGKLAKEFLQVLTIFFMVLSAEATVDFCSKCHKTYENFQDEENFPFSFYSQQMQML